MTHRERREARADRLREWADKREGKGKVQIQASDAKAALIPFGQPILQGHHSEQRDRNYRAGIRSGLERGYEDLSKAEDFRRRAEGIDEAAERAIYSDDPVAVERLKERIAELEAKRDLYKAENAAYRKEHPEVRGMTPWQKNQVLPRPSYSTANLSANINRQKKRLAELTGTVEVHPHLACPHCGSEDTRWFRKHYECWGCGHGFKGKTP